MIRHGPTFEVLAKNKLDDGFDASPALVDNEIFLRGYEHLPTRSPSRGEFLSHCDRGVNGRLVAEPIEDEINVDSRRAARRRLTSEPGGGFGYQPRLSRRRMRASNTWPRGNCAPAR